ncbi:PAS domain S-box protein [Candidatus Bipolaricaulota bacterium]|nr:PAS domain S-box protein [Candidatus Bipolaricaulota bacterium]
MGKENKEKEQLIHELAELRQQVDELKKAEAKRLSAGQAGKEAEEDLDRIFNLSSDMVCISGFDGYAKRLNPAFEKTLGYTNEEILAKPFLDFVHPDDRAATIAELQKLAAGTPTVHFEQRCRCKDGSYKWLAWTNAPVVEEGLMYAVARDITEQKKTEHEVEKRRLYLEKVLTNAPDAIVTLDAQHKILEWNVGAERLFGYTLEEVFGRNIDDLITGPDPDVFEEATGFTRQVLAGKSTHPTETIRYRKDGSPVDVIVSGSPILMGNEVIGVVTVYTNITERKWAEEVLRENEEKYRAVFENTGTATVIVEEDTTISLANRGFENLSGFSKGEIEGKKRWTEFVVKEDLERMKEQHNLRRKDPKAALKSYEFRFVDRDGKIKDVILVIDMIPGTKKSVASLLDITERKRVAEEIRVLSQFQEILIDNANVWLNVLDEKGNVVIWNKAAENISGYSREEVVGHDKIWEWLYPDEKYRKEAFEKAMIAAKRGETYTGDETIIRTKYGQTRIISWNERGLLDEKGKPLGSIALGRDVTEHKQAEEALRESRRKIESLHEIACQVDACETEDEIYRLTVKAAEEILDFSMCTLDIVEDNKLVVKATSSKVSPDASRQSDLDEGLAGKTYRTGETYIFGSLDEVPEAMPTRGDFKSGISTPIGDIGVFQVAATEPHAFTQDDARLLELLLSHTTEVLKRIHLQNELKEQAIHDPLTGVYNRRYFTQTIESELERSKRYSHSISFLMIDVNRFKEINDRFGHQVGDRVLQGVGRLLKEQVRGVDIVIRYGGDEFLILLPETNSATEAIVQRIHNAVAKQNEEGPLIEFPITLAIGKSCWRPESTETIETILHKADQQMYEDKRRHESGRSVGISDPKTDEEG